MNGLLDLPAGWIGRAYGGGVPDWLHIPPGLYLRGPRGSSVQEMCLRVIMERKGRLRDFPELLNVRLRFELLKRLEAVGIQLRIKGRRWSTSYRSEDR